MLIYKIPKVDWAWMILPDDDAVEWDSSDIGKYIQTLDEKCLSIKPDKRPVRCRVLACTPSIVRAIAKREHIEEADLILDSIHDGALARVIAQYLINEVSPSQPDGWPKPMTVRKYGRRMLSDEAMEGLDDMQCISVVAASTHLWAKVNNIPLSSESQSEKVNGENNTLQIATSAESEPIDARGKNRVANGTKKKRR